MFFEDYFEINSSAVEVNVACPFTHHTINGIPYLEANPSAHINTQERVFHCKACGVGHSETSFIQAILGCSFVYAKKLFNCFNTDEDIVQWKNDTTLSANARADAHGFGISDAVLDELNIASSDENNLCFLCLCTGIY